MRPGTKFGEQLRDHFVSLVFGSGVFALRGVVVGVHEDYLVLRAEKDDALIHVPFSSILYARLGVKVDVG